MVAKGNAIMYNYRKPDALFVETTGGKCCKTTLWGKI
jgi:hypothetical protein